MKKTTIYLIFLLLLCFLLPVFFTSKFAEKEVKKQPEAKVITPSTYDYQSYQTIKLLRSKTNTIEEVKLDEYLYGVVASEMPADFHSEALSAQAIVARTYTIYKIQHNNGNHSEANICDSFACCQAWISKEDRFARWEESKREDNWAKIVEAVNSTQGKYITYNGEPIEALFHSNSGGTTEVPINVWGGSSYPYLQSVQTAGEDTYQQYSSEVSLTKEEVVAKVKEKHTEIEVDWMAEDAIKIVEHTQANRVKTIKIGNVNLSGVELRSLLGLKSTNFEVSVEGEVVKFTVKGYGHGVGMSQTGADSMAKAGSQHEEIIKHFYTGVEIKNM